jgi:hypothetical protein
MRFFIADDKPLTLNDLEAGLKTLDHAYAVRNIEFETLGELFYDDTLLAGVEINLPDEEIFQDDVAEFLDLVGQGDNEPENRVRDILTNARQMVVVEAFWKGTDNEPVLEKIDPLWDWLFAHYPGLSQADNEGFYDVSGLILERRFTL